MSKKLLSIILSILFLGKTFLSLPTTAVNKKGSNITTSQNENSYKRPTPDQSKTKNSKPFGIKDCIYFAAHIIAAILFGGGMYYYIGSGTSENKPQTDSQPQSNPEEISGTQTESGSAMPPLHPQNNPEEISKTQDEKSKDKPIPTPKSKQKEHKDKQTKKSSENQNKPKKSPRVPKQKTPSKSDSISKPQQPMPQQREVIEELKNDTNACSTPIPLRSIAWHDNRCWLYSSLMCFYYYMPYHNFILDFPINEAEQLLPTLATDQERSALEAMISLTKTFRTLKGNVTQDHNYHQPQVIHLDAQQENELIEKLGAYNSIVPRLPETLNHRSCGAQAPCPLVITSLLEVVSTNIISLYSNSPELMHWAYSLPDSFDSLNANLFNQFPIKHSNPQGGHFWVEVKHNGITYAIGKYTLPHQSSIIRQSRKK